MENQIVEAIVPIACHSFVDVQKRPLNMARILMAGQGIFVQNKYTLQVHLKIAFFRI